MPDDVPTEDASSAAPQEISDHELVAQVQAGNTAAFEKLIEKYKSRLYGVIYNMLGNHEDAADLSQETFIRAFKSMSGFRSKANFYTWLYRIGVNTTLNFIKKRKDGHFSLNEWSSEVDEEPVIKELTSIDNAGNALSRQELQEKLNEALQKLSEEHRAVVVLHDIEGMRHQEIAKVLGCSEATARSRLFYAHQQLQALLANYI
jgi:RNA polymerase sigma-70 factor, ECF subfamily